MQNYYSIGDISQTKQILSHGLLYRFIDLIVIFML